MRFFITAVFLFSINPVFAANKVVVAYFGRQSAEEFEKVIKPSFHEFASSCKSCEIVDMTPYDGEKKVDDKSLTEKVRQLSDDINIVFFHWNDRDSKRYKDLIDELNNVTDKGKILIAFSGAPSDNDKTCPLNKTIFAQVPQAVIVGELQERDRLWPRDCYFGPEILTAVRPPKSLMGKGLAPLMFSARLATQWSRRSSSEWIAYLKTKKNKSKRLWPELEEFFP